MQAMTTVQSIVYEEGEEGSELQESKSSKRSGKPTMTRQECIEYQIEAENEKCRLMIECITSGKHAELKASGDKVRQQAFFQVT